VVYSFLYWKFFRERAGPWRSLNFILLKHHAWTKKQVQSFLVSYQTAVQWTIHVFWLELIFEVSALSCQVSIACEMLLSQFQCVGDNLVVMMYRLKFVRYQFDSFYRHMFGYLLSICERHQQLAYTRIMTHLHLSQVVCNSMDHFVLRCSIRVYTKTSHHQNGPQFS